MAERRAVGLAKIADVMMEIQNLNTFKQQLRTLANDAESANQSLADYKKKLSELSTKQNTWVNDEGRPHSTICNDCIASKTPHICHERCGLRELKGENENHFCNCACMTGRKAGRVICGKCPSVEGAGCGARSHTHRRGYLDMRSATADSAIRDIEAKSKSEEGRYKHATTAKAAAEADLKMVEKRVNTKQEEVAKIYRRILELCSGYNITAELSATISKLQQEAATIRDLEARQDADKQIKRLQDLVVELAKVVPKGAVKDIDPSKLDILYAVDDDDEEETIEDIAAAAVFGYAAEAHAAEKNGGQPGDVEGYDVEENEDDAEDRTENEPRVKGKGDGSKGNDKGNGKGKGKGLGRRKSTWGLKAGKPGKVFMANILPGISKQEVAEFLAAEISAEPYEFTVVMMTPRDDKPGQAAKITMPSNYVRQCVDTLMRKRVDWSLPRGLFVVDDRDTK